MRVHRVYVPTLTEQGEANNTITLHGREAHHLAHVLRVSTGQAVRAFDGRGHEADGVVVDIAGDVVVLELSPPQASDVESTWQVHIAVGLLKGDKLADVVRQVTELGAVSVQPFTSRFGDVPKASPNKLSRWRRIAQEAAKQSGRSLVPEVHEPVKVGVLEPLRRRSNLQIIRRKPLHRQPIRFRDVTSSQLQHQTLSASNHLSDNTCRGVQVQGGVGFDAPTRDGRDIGVGAARDRT
jgi:RsmE family RNA methyltransferase